MVVVLAPLPLHANCDSVHKSVARFADGGRILPGIEVESMLGLCRPSGKVHRTALPFRAGNVVRTGSPKVRNDATIEGRFSFAPAVCDDMTLVRLPG